MTKDQLIAENAQLKAEVERLARTSAADFETASSRDQDVRKELSKALGAPAKSDRYGEREMLTYSWFEIFREVGKLLAARTFYDIEGNVSELEVKVKQLEERETAQNCTCTCPLHSPR